MFLARGTAVLEPVQRLWRTVSGPMEHADALSVVPVLSFVSAVLVVGDVLSGTLVSGGAGDVFSGASLDGQPSGGGIGGRSVCVQRPHLARAAVAEQYRGAGLDALGRAGSGRSVAARRARCDFSSAGGGNADACGSARNHLTNMVCRGSIVGCGNFSRRASTSADDGTGGRSGHSGGGIGRGAIAAVLRFVGAFATGCQLR